MISGSVSASIGGWGGEVDAYGGMGATAGGNATAIGGRAGPGGAGRVAVAASVTGVP
ncbi:MAG: hypothetical protein WD825_11540 [Gemmatimonadaceae bacterium]